MLCVCHISSLGIEDMNGQVVAAICESDTGLKFIS